MGTYHEYTLAALRPEALAEARDLADAFTPPSDTDYQPWSTRPAYGQIVHAKYRTRRAAKRGQP